MTESPSLNVLRYGAETPLPEQTRLCAGPLSLIFEAGDLRYIHYGDHEILRRVYVAVRDQNWDTVPARIEDLELATEADEFRLTFDVCHADADIEFVWRATITGASDGAIRFNMDGKALTSFLRNRIGFCVLHPDTCAGRPCHVEHVDGSVEKGAFPVRISPHQPFMDMRAITHEVAPGLEAEVRFSGDTFEMEDQRNWTDASYKTYSTPLAFPFPVAIAAGERISQSVSLQLHGAPHVTPVTQGSVRGDTDSGITLSLVDTQAAVLPALGLGLASHGQPLDETEIERLKRLDLRHLRVDLHLYDSNMAARLRQAWQEARALDVELEVALFVSDAARAELATLRTLLEEIRPAVCRWLIFHRAEKSTSARWIDAARLSSDGYEPAAPIGSGTNAYFTEINRERPPIAVLDFVTYSLNPQVHAFDNASLIETLATQGTTVRSASAFSDGLPIHVSPITLRPRFNPNATGPEAESAPGELPDQVDPRQMSLFCAVWTAGSLKYLAENGAHAVTYFETTGWRGVMETSAGSPLPARFHSIAGAVFPVYHLFADIGEFSSATVLPSKSSDPLWVEALVLAAGSTRSVWLANLTPRRQTVSLEGVIKTERIRMLDETNMLEAMRDPEKFRVEAPVYHPTPPKSVELQPYALARIDGTDPLLDERQP